MKYKFKRNADEEGYFIIENGHTMFPEDVKKRLKRLSFLEENKIELKKQNEELVETLISVTLELKKLQDTESQLKAIALILSTERIAIETLEKIKQKPIEEILG